MRNAFLRTAVVFFFFGIWTGSAFGEAAPRLAEGYGRVPIAFEPNRGQADEKVRFVAQGRGYRVFLTEEETVIALQRGDRTHLVVPSTPPTSICRWYTGARWARRPMASQLDSNS